MLVDISAEIFCPWTCNTLTCCIHHRLQCSFAGHWLNHHIINGRWSFIEGSTVCACVCVCVCNIVTCMLVARERLGNHIPVWVNGRKNRKPTARQRISKHASLKIEAVFSVGSVQSSYIEVFGSIESRSREWRVEFRDVSLPGYELGSRGIELSRQ
jgi:hypothetical protein